MYVSSYPSAAYVPGVFESVKLILIVNVAFGSSVPSLSCLSLLQKLFPCAKNESVKLTIPARLFLLAKRSTLPLIIICESPSVVYAKFRTVE